MPLTLGLDHSFARDLEGAYRPGRPESWQAPRTVFLDLALARELGLPPAALSPEASALLFSGSEPPLDARPIAQAYAGHQFGGFAPQLGDGRALLLGELQDRAGRRRDLVLKGSGATPYSRGGDGRAALGPMLREVLIGTCLHALGIPTTRALAVVATGETVWREGPLPGAVLARIASSHLRVGTFQYFAARGDSEGLTRLLRYTLVRHDPAEVGAERDAIGLLKATVTRQADLLARWMDVGFIHGVMNTDNMTLSGESIDFGPCAFLEAYDPNAVFSSIDRGGRYAFGNQPRIAQWNLARLAEALLPLIDADESRAIERATIAISDFVPRYEQRWLEARRARLGLTRAEPGDAALAQDFLDLLASGGADHTLAWRELADAAAGADAPLRRRIGESVTLDEWIRRWRDRASREGDSASQWQDRAAAMRRASPRIVARNHRVEEALAAASGHADFGPFERLLDALRRPFDEDPQLAPYAEPAPPGFSAGYRTYCGT